MNTRESTWKFGIVLAIALLAPTGVPAQGEPGSIVAWGWNGYGQCNVPGPNTDFVVVAAGRYHSFGLKSYGAIVAWGSNGYGQCDVPAPNPGFVAVAGGANHSLAIRGRILGDEDCDGDVDLADLAGLLGAYGSCEGDPFYNPGADLDAGGDVDLADLAELLGVYGTTCP
jgi:hypothetical protein